MFDKLIDVFLNFLGLFKFWEVVDEYQKGVILRLGRFQKQVEPGLHWVIPFGVDRLVDLNVVTKTADLPPSFLTLRDGSTACVSVVVRYNVRDVKRAILEVDHVTDAIKDAVNGNVSSLVRAANWEELNSPEFANNLPKECRKRAWRYGIEIEDVTLSDLAKARVIGLLGNAHTPQQTH